MLAIVQSVELNVLERDLRDDRTQLTECCRDTMACTAVTGGKKLRWDL